jgi:hypothetical protein
MRLTKKMTVKALLFIKFDIIMESSCACFFLFEYVFEFEFLNDSFNLYYTL